MLGFPHKSCKDLFQVQCAHGCQTPVLSKAAMTENCKTVIFPGSLLFILLKKVKTLKITSIITWYSILVDLMILKSQLLMREVSSTLLMYGYQNIFSNATRVSLIPFISYSYWTNTSLVQFKINNH